MEIVMQYEVNYVSLLNFFSSFKEMQVHMLKSLFACLDIDCMRHQLMKF